MHNQLGYPPNFHTDYFSAVQEPVTFKRQRIIGGVFFKVNHLFDFYVPYPSFQHFDLTLEHQSMSQHRAVIRKAIKQYFQDENYEQILDYAPKVIENDSYENKEARKMIDDFAILLETYLSEYNQAKVQKWVLQSPFRLFMIVALISEYPDGLFQDILVLVIKGIQFYDDFCRQNPSKAFQKLFSEYLKQQLESESEQLCSEMCIMTNKTENLKNAIFKITFTSALATYGQFKNSFYQKSQQNEQKKLNLNIQKRREHQKQAIKKGKKISYRELFGSNEKKL